MDEISSRQYREECQSIAQEIAEECGYQTEAGNARLWETIDGHQWVIYTFYNYQVLQHSENDGYAIEEFGVETATTDGVLNTAALAFGAMYADVSEAYASLEEPEDEDAA